MYFKIWIVILLSLYGITWFLARDARELEGIFYGAVFLGIYFLFGLSVALKLIISKKTKASKTPVEEVVPKETNKIHWLILVAISLFIYVLILPVLMIVISLVNLEGVFNVILANIIAAVLLSFLLIARADRKDLALLTFWLIIATISIGLFMLAQLPKY